MSKHDKEALWAQDRAEMGTNAGGAGQCFSMLGSALQLQLEANQSLTKRAFVGVGDAGVPHDIGRGLLPADSHSLAKAGHCTDIIAHQQWGTGNGSCSTPSVAAMLGTTSIWRAPNANLPWT
jgi:hypothetical protein